MPGIREEYREIPLEKLRVSPYNIRERFKEEDVDHLFTFIKTADDPELVAMVYGYKLLEILSNVGVVELQDVVIRAKKLVIRPKGRGEHGGR